jgi:hypothetical protein
MPILDYAPPPTKRGTSYSSIAVAVPLLFVLLSTLVLDNGVSAAICESAAGGFWAGTIMMAIRRHKRLTEVDRVYLVLGYPMALIAAVVLMVVLTLILGG